MNQHTTGANGELAGSDVRVIHKTQRKINVVGINGHELAGLDVVTAARVLNRKISMIFPQYLAVVVLITLAVLKSD